MRKYTICLAAAAALMATVPPALAEGGPSASDGCCGSGPSDVQSGNRGEGSSFDDAVRRELDRMINRDIGRSSSAQEEGHGLATFHDHINGQSGRNPDGRAASRHQAEHDKGGLHARQ